jgi:hypothetical protein
MLEEQFVPHEIAHMLVEWSFNEQCLAYYQNEKLIIRMESLKFLMF